MNKEFFINNREKALEMMDDNSLMVLFSTRIDEDNFRINRNFYYLSGLDEESDIIILEKTNNESKSICFIEEYDEVKSLWVGTGLGKEKVMEISGFLNIEYLPKFKDRFNELIKNKSKIYIDLNHPDFIKGKTFEEQFVSELNIEKCDLNPILAHLRTIKDKCEVDNIKQAITITNEGIKAILDNLKPGLYEYQIESFFDQKIKYHGGDGYSFKTIAASGSNACCLHYSSNKDIMKDDDLILFDLGSTYNKYCADISRTFPVNGKFSEKQKEIYNIVLEAQERAFRFLKPGVTLKEANEEVKKYYSIKLKEIGLIKEDDEVKKYYYHGVSHHLGLDCHDNCEYTPLKEGSVVTVEPGLYIKELGIGIRIEDDALITKDGCINLSSDIIKTVEEIENYMNK